MLLGFVYGYLRGVISWTQLLVLVFVIPILMLLGFRRDGERDYPRSLVLLMDVPARGCLQLSGFCRWVVGSMLAVVLARVGKDRVRRRRIGPPRDVLACLVVGSGVGGSVGIWFRIASRWYMVQYQYNFKHRIY